MWRLGLVIVGVISYYASMLAVAAKLRRFHGSEESTRRLRLLCWTPYFTDGILAGLAGLLNPAGLFYIVASALPSTLGTNAGLLSLPSVMRKWSRREEEQVGPIQRSVAWIAPAATASLLFIVLLGRGVTWPR